MHDAPLYAALPEGQAARHPLPLYSKLQQRFAVGAALGQGAVLYGGLITGGLHVALKTAERQPCQRVEPVQTDCGIKQRLGQRVTAADVGLLMQQHGLPGRALQTVRQIDARAQDAQRERCSHTGPAVAAVRCLAGQRNAAAEPPIACKAAQRQHQHTGQPDCRQYMPGGQPGVPRQRDRSGGCCRCQIRKRQRTQLLHGVGGCSQRGALRAGQPQRNAPREHEPYPYGQPQPAQQTAGGVGAAQRSANAPDCRCGHRAACAEQQKGKYDTAHNYPSFCWAASSRARISAASASLIGFELRKAATKRGRLPPKVLSTTAALSACWTSSRRIRLVT